MEDPWTIRHQVGSARDPAAWEAVADKIFQALVRQSRLPPALLEGEHSSRAAAEMLQQRLQAVHDVALATGRPPRTLAEIAEDARRSFLQDRDWPDPAAPAAADPPLFLPGVIGSTNIFAGGMVTTGKLAISAINPGVNDPIRAVPAPQPPAPAPIGGGWWCFTCRAFVHVSESMADGDTGALCFTCGERHTARRYA